jgi:chromosome partitioning protein
MKILGLLSRKGGVGKTTFAVHLAVLAQQAGRRTLLIDLDPQRSAAGWWRAREADTPLLVETEPAGLRGVLDAARDDGIDLVVIDTRPSVEADAVHVATLADLLVVPTRPAILDLRAILGTLDIVKGATRRAMIVLNACPAPRGIGEASVTGDARRALAAFGVPVAAPSIGNRATFSHALVAGLTAGEAEPGGKAAKEVSALWRVIDREISQNEKAQPSSRIGKKGPASDGSIARASRSPAASVAH